MCLSLTSRLCTVKYMYREKCSIFGGKEEEEKRNENKIHDDDNDTLKRAERKIERHIATEKHEIGKC